MNQKKEEFSAILGLEVHITINSEKKIFNWNEIFRGEGKANEKAGAWELGYLGTLPIINPEVIKLALKLSLSLGMKISDEITFDRKIYDYFDLAKGYQITQKKNPLATEGFFSLIKEGKLVKVAIKNIQLEEDTAKSIYTDDGVKLDFNRAGNPLIEIVTEPVFKNIDEVIIFLEQLQFLLRYLEISEAKMEKGQLRVDLNISFQNENFLTERLEIKNLNSFKNIKKSFNCEWEKQGKRETKREEKSKTLRFDEKKQKNIFQREKKEYFYLPEYNLPPISLEREEIKKIKDSLPVLPWDFWKNLIEKGISEEKTNLIFKNLALIKTIKFLEEKNFSPNKIEKWIIFLINFLKKIDEKNIYEFFLKKNEEILLIFKAWNETKIGNKETDKLIEKVIAGEKIEIKKIEPVEEELEKLEEIDKYLEKMWEKEISIKFLEKPQKVKNFLLGRLKNFLPLQEKILIKKLNEFLQKKS